MVTRIGEFILDLILAIVIVFALCKLAHCKERVPNRSNSLGVEQFYENPNTYLFASVADGKVFEDSEGRYFTNVRFQPFNTFQLYTESVLFCGNAADQFNGKSGPLVITYQKSSHRSYQGIGCHILEGVNEVTVPREDQ